MKKPASHGGRGGLQATLKRYSVTAPPAIVSKVPEV